MYVEQLEEKDALLKKNLEKQKGIYELFSEDKINLELYKDRAELLRNEEKKLKQDIKAVQLKILDKRNSVNLVKATQDFLLRLRNTPDNNNLQMDYLMKTFMRIIFRSIHIQNQEIVKHDLNEPWKTCYEEGMKWLKTNEKTTKQAIPEAKARRSYECFCVPSDVHWCKWCEIIAVILKKVSGCDKKGQGGRYNSSKYLSPEMTEIKWDDRINNLFILGAGFDKAFYPSFPTNDELRDCLISFIDSDQCPHDDVRIEILDYLKSRNQNIELILTDLDVGILSSKDKKIIRIRSGISAYLVRYFKKQEEAVQINLSDNPWIKKFCNEILDTDDVLININYTTWFLKVLDMLGYWDPRGGFCQHIFTGDHGEERSNEKKRNIRVYLLHGCTEFKCSGGPDMFCSSSFNNISPIDILNDLKSRNYYGFHEPFTWGANSSITKEVAIDRLNLLLKNPILYTTYLKQKRVLFSDKALDIYYQLSVHDRQCLDECEYEIIYLNRLVLGELYPGSKLKEDFRVGSNLSIDFNARLFPCTCKSIQFSTGFSDKTGYVVLPSYLKQYHVDLERQRIQAIKIAERARNLIIVGCGLRNEDNGLWQIITSFWNGVTREFKKKVFVLDKNKDVFERIKDHFRSMHGSPEDFSSYAVPIKEDIEGGGIELLINELRKQKDVSCKAD